MKKGKVSESIFSGMNNIIPMADVQHVERHYYPSDVDRTKDNYRGLTVVTCHTKWSQVMDAWENPIYLPKDEANDFLKAWTYYRFELEGNIKQPFHTNTQTPERNIPNQEGAMCHHAALIK